MAPLCRWLLAAAVLAAGFECDGNRSLPAAYVNDGYCDCIDRSDEPRTGACPDTTFTCANWPLSIPASHVGDGVCDCCDGSDEAGLAPGVRQPGSQCVDTCVDLAMDDFGALERGCIARGEMIRSGREARDRDAARLAEARAELAAHTPLLDSLRSAVASASAAEAAAMDSRRARLEAGEVDRALGIERLEPEMVVRALARLALAGGMEGVDRLYDMLLAQPGMEGADDLDAADFIDIAMRARDEERGAGVSGREAGSSVSEGGPLLEATPSSHGLDGASPPHGGAAPGHGDPAHNGCVPAGDDGSSTVGSDASPAGTCGVLSSSPHETELVALLVPLPTPPVLSVLRAFYWATSQVAELAQAARGMLASSASPLSDADIAAAIELASPFRHAPADEARAAVAGAEAGLERCRRVEAELASQEALAAAGAYGEEGEWWALHGRCFKHTEGESRYSVCPFRYLKQEGRLVGNFSGFTNGDPCAGGVRRSGSVIFQCGETNEVLAVTEPVACSYVVAMRSPAACSVRLLRRRLADLRAATRAAGREWSPSPEGFAVLGESMEV